MDTLKTSFPNVKEISRPVIELSNSLDPNWVSGLLRWRGWCGVVGCREWMDLWSTNLWHPPPPTFYIAITSKTDQVRIVNPQLRFSLSLIPPSLWLSHHFFFLLLSSFYTLFFFAFLFFSERKKKVKKK